MIYSYSGSQIGYRCTFANDQTIKYVHSVTEGQLAITTMTSTFSQLAFQAGMHAHIGGMMSLGNGGSYGSGALSGAVGSLGAAGTGKLLRGAGRGWQAAGMIGSGALLGGIGSEITGGNFWDGFRNGAISSALNHAMHLSQEKRIQKARELIKKYQRTDDRIMAQSIVIEALMEISDGSELLTKSREILIDVYGSSESKMYDTYSAIIEMSKGIVNSGAIPKDILYKILIGLGVDTIRLQIVNSIRLHRIEALDVNLYNAHFKPFLGGSGGGGATTHF